MMRIVLFITVMMLSKLSTAQKIDSIYFHLYTDSLKKGFYNYINVDGKTSDGQWFPLTAKEVEFTTASDSTLRFQNNDLFIDSAYTKESVTVRATLKNNPIISKEVTIYIRKRGFDEALKTNEEVLEDFTKPKGKKKGR